MTREKGRRHSFRVISSTMVFERELSEVKYDVYDVGEPGATVQYMKTSLIYCCCASVRKFLCDPPLHCLILVQSCLLVHMLCCNPLSHFLMVRSRRDVSGCNLLVAIGPCLSSVNGLLMLFVPCSALSSCYARLGNADAHSCGSS
jgi:hypothetical protein